jgi:flagellar basal body-associated protein FliL
MGTWVVIIAVGIVLAIVVAMWFKNKKTTTAQENVEEPVSPEMEDMMQRENAIVQIQVKASLLGLPAKTNINSLIDKCAQLHNALSSVNPTDKIQLHSAPADFERLIEKHLPETIDKFGQIFATATDEDINKFNELIEQLKGELDGIITNLNERDYAAFANKHGFMEIRYSDKF